MQLRHDPTFFWATALLPADRRPAVHALYGYVRGADELVDSPRVGGDRRAHLDAWQHALEEGLERGPPGRRVGRPARPVDQLVGPAHVAVERVHRGAHVARQPRRRPEERRVVAQLHAPAARVGLPQLSAVPS